MSGDELLHQMKHAAAQQAGDTVPIAFGHISSYDPKLHRVRLIVPSWIDDGGNPVLTGWMPLATGFAGLSYGLQIAPVGGATPQKPTQGEPCIIQLMRKGSGTSVCAGMFFNQTTLPPFTDLQAGECGLMAKSGSFIRFKQDNSVVLDTTKNNGKVQVNAGSGEIDLTSTTKVSISGGPEIDLAATLTTINCNTRMNGNPQISGHIQSETGGTYAGDLVTAGEVIAKSGVGQVGLSTHSHHQPADSHGDTEGPTAAPTGGT